MGRLTTSRRVTAVRIRDGRVTSARSPDVVAVEEPLDIRVNGEQLSVTMRTPGHDVELVHGLLHAEGIIRDREDVHEARYCDGAVVEDESGLPRNTYNVMDLSTRDRLLIPIPTHALPMNSACGVCGSTSIDAVQSSGRYTLTHDWSIAPATILAAADELRARQRIFERTGGVHAAALVHHDGEMLVTREDVGRHNAVDKVIGWALMEGRLPAADCFLVVSSRASFEIAQKAYLAGIGLLACVSAPSSLAIETAERVGMTLIGFTRSRGDGEGRMNVYTGRDRLDLDPAG